MLAISLLITSLSLREISLNQSSSEIKIKILVEWKFVSYVSFMPGNMSPSLASVAQDIMYLDSFKLF